MTEQDQHDGTATAEGEHPANTPQIDARWAMLIARVGDRFSQDERAHLRRDIARQVDLAAQLRTVPLTNADEPGTIFMPEATGDAR